MRLGWLIVAMSFAGSGVGAQAAEIEFRHINDLFSASRMEDDLYTATIGFSGTVRGWTLDLDEYLFTDKTHGLRFDETHLTVARDLLKPDSKWGVRARGGVVRVGRGIHGQRLQNFIHTVLAQEKLRLPYVEGVRSSAFIRVNVARTVFTRTRTAVTSQLEVESAGFKRHARAALATEWDLGGSFELRAAGGVRWTDSNFAPLARWIDEIDPTVALGVAYKANFELTWTRNYFGTGDSHWHLTARLQFK